jgi:hypothetical protein
VCVCVCMSVCVHTSSGSFGEQMYKYTCLWLCVGVVKSGVPTQHGSRHHSYGKGYRGVWVTRMDATPRAVSRSFRRQCRCSRLSALWPGRSGLGRSKEVSKQHQYSDEVSALPLLPHRLLNHLQPHRHNCTFGPSHSWLSSWQGSDPVVNNCAGAGVAESA